VALWVTLSLAGVALSWETWRKLADTVDRGVLAAAQNDRLEGVFRALLNAETGERGFLVTGKESNLTPLYEAQTVLDGEFKSLAALATNDPEMIQQVVTLRGLAELRLNEIRQSVSVRREQGFEAAAVRVEQSKSTMDKIRTLVEQMRRARPNLLTLEADEPRRQLRRASYTSFTAGLVGVGAGLFAFYLARVALRHEKRERELAQATLRAEENSKQKSAFLANMSHEIRTPMNSILGFSELLAESVQEPRQRQYLRSLRASAHSLLQLINDVLDMSKAETGMLQLRPEPTDPREMCEFITTVFSEQVTRTGLHLTAEVADDVPKALLIDRSRLRQILVNLVGNAIKYTEYGYIRVGVDWEKSSHSNSRIALLIDVEDTGCGVVQEELDSIFEPFVQASQRRPQGREGVGLGLSIVKRLTEAMGGTVIVASVVGKGTTFHLRFPEVPVSVRLPASQQVSTELNADFNSLRASKLLVVDDNQTNRDLIDGMFSGGHHHLSFAANGEEAVHAAREMRPDVVLMDIRMPVLDGYAALEKIRKTPGLELLPVIAVTASGHPSDTTRIRRAFTGCLSKPFSRLELFNELSHYLPRAEQPAHSPAPREDWSPSSPPAERREAWIELAARLREIKATEWESVRETMSVSEVRLLAQRLHSLGQEYECSTLTLHAEALQADCEAFAIPDMEEHLRAFPGVIGEIERHTT
jgi:signal transduction histidine kinase/DNA-binding response OmpR family regulator